MRAVRFHEHGGPDVLQVEDVETPSPGDGEVLIRVEASGVNPVDTYFRNGSYTLKELPFTPGVDVAGEVEAVGAGVEAFDVGDRVFGTGIGNMAYQGGQAEFAVAPTSNLAVLPDSVSFLVGGAAGVVAGTAFRSLIEHGGLQAAESCLIHGGSGGVGHAAVQIAAASGADVIATAAPEYHDAVEDLGANAVLDYGRTDLADAVREAAGGGVDVILDHRLDEYLQFDVDVAKTGTRVVGIGNTKPEAGYANIAAARSKDIELRLISLFNSPDVAALLDNVGWLMGEGLLEISVAREYGFDEVADAQRDVMDESFLGKLVVTP